MAAWTLSPLDISFLSLETPATPMTIGAVAVLDSGPDETDSAATVALLRERAARIPRLRRRLRSELFPPVGASWVEDPEFRVEDHVRLHRAVGAGEETELNAWVARTMAIQLDRRRPLWSVHVLDGLSGGRTAVLFQVHHAFLDGLGTGALAYALADGGSPDLVPAPQDHGAAPRASLDPRRLLGPLAGLTDPPALARTAARALSTATGVVTHLTTAGPGFPFDTVVSPARAFATTSLALEDLRGLRAVPRSSVNDVAIGVVAGAIRSWLQTHGYRADDLRLRALVPVAGERPPGSGSGNAFSAFLLDLPVHLADPVARIRFVAEEMARHRAAGPEGGAGALAGLANLLPAAAVRLGGPTVAQAASKLFDLLITTVPAPRPMRIGGVPIVAVYPLAPLGPNQPLAIGCASYAGRMHIGFSVDPVVVPGPDQLAAAVPAELAVLRTVAGLPAPAVPAPR